MDGRLPQEVHEARDRVVSSVSLEEVYRAAVAGFEDIVAFDACELVATRDDAEWCRASSGSGESAVDTSLRSTVVEAVTETADPLVISDLTDEDQPTSNTDVRSLLAVQLGGQGVAVLTDTDPDAFDDHDLVLAELFGAYVGQKLASIEPESSPMPPDLATALLDVADVMMVVLDPSGRITYTNRRARTVLGYEDGELLGRDWFQTCLPERHRDDVSEVFEQLVNGTTEPAERIENQVVTKDGEERLVEWHNAVLRDEDGDISAVLSSGLDITALRASERALADSQQRYRTLLRAAPDPVFVVDTDTGEIIETNPAAEEFRGQPEDELVSLTQTDLHPEEEADTYRELFEDCFENGGTVQSLPNGDPIYAVTADGERIPVAVSIGTTRLDGSTVAYEIFRDVTEQRAYERTLSALTETTPDLFGASSPTEVADRTVGVVTEVVGLAGATVYSFDESDGVLRPTAHSWPEDHGTPPSPSAVDPGDGIVWQVFAEGEGRVIGDVPSGGEPNLATPFRSGMVVPLGEYGVLVVGDTEPTAFDSRSRDVVRILATTAEAAIGHVRRRQDLETRERQLQRRTDQLERLEGINSRIRDVARAIVHSSTRREIEQTVCEELVDSASFGFAWIGAVDPVTDTLTPRASAGDDRGYLDAVDLHLPDESVTEPAVQAARTNDSVVVTNAASDITREEWREEVLARGYQSLMSIPLVYQGTLRGVLTVFSANGSIFSERLQSVLSELGALIAHAIVAAERKQALLSNQTTELEFDIGDSACFFLRFAQDTNCTLELERIIPQSDDTSLVFVEVTEGSPEQLLAEANESSTVKTARLVQSEANAVVQLRIVEPFIASILADHGIDLRNISADDSECRVTVGVPPTASVHQVVDVVSSTYRDTEVLAKREQAEPARFAGDFADRVLQKLTPRQREVAEMAYLSGYFDSPRAASGEELASELDFSASAFHRHIRAAERKLFEAIFAADRRESAGRDDG